MKLPKLYKRNKNGSIQYWQIEVLPVSGPGPFRAVIGGELVVEHGQVGTDSPQRTSEIISKGKNIGKANETSAYEQAMAEAQARFDKQVKKNYVVDISRAENSESDVEGGINPMLAYVFEDHKEKIVYPSYIQPKADGMRLIAVIKNGKATLWSRTRKPITSLPHIQAELEKCFPLAMDLILDGEAYSDELKADFEKIVSAVRKEEASEGSKQIQFHIYDIVSTCNYKERLSALMAILPRDNPILIPMETFEIESDAMVGHFHDLFVSRGFEGAMVRSGEGGYEFRRSYTLQKVKIMRDAEFPIVGCKEGRGKMAGHAIFQCATDSGETFDVKMNGSMARLKELFENPHLWTGKKLTVQYQKLSAYGTPIFPIGLRIRDGEDL